MTEMERESERFLSSLHRSVDAAFEPLVVFPGKEVTTEVTSFSKNISLGEGLFQQGDRVLCSTTGVLRYREPVSYWIDIDKKYYIPKNGDQVVGIIEDRGGDYYRVNIFSGSIALLSRLGFEGASKRNKPELKVGDLVYCKVHFTHKDLDTELTCISSSGVKKGWSSGETIYGDLEEGITARVSPKTAKLLLNPDCVVLNLLGRHIAYEVAVGMNGLIWIQSGSVKESVIVRNAILNSVELDEIQTEAMVDVLLETLHKKPMHRS